MIPRGFSSNLWSDRLIDRLAYAHDASMYRLVPKAVSRPENESDVISILQYANDTNTPVTFRAGGTSLSGQSVSEGIIAEIIRGWQNHKIIDNGRSIQLQPGVIGARANLYLSHYNRRIGPDPASINAARIGGIVSNNSSGMVCGVKYNTYHTMKNIRFILANGNTYDTSNKDDYTRFINHEVDLANGLSECRKKINNNGYLLKRINDKYLIKNTLGYSLNALVDYDHPLDIFAHLIVGSEGTLAFLSNIELLTIDDPPSKTTGLVIFDNIEEATSALNILIDEGADAIELMDDASLRTAKHIQNAPYDYSSIVDNASGLLFEFQRQNQVEIDRIKDQILSSLSSANGSLPLGMTENLSDRNALWNIRKGLYPTVGALRKKGTSVLNEDLCYDYRDLPKVVKELKSICNHWNYKDAVLFGHAKDGNIHFAASMDLNSNEGKKRFEGLMQDMVDMTVGKFNGSLKAEHGTGRNMAPFVEYEWGGELYQIMWKIKKLSDPNNILNPDVLLTKNQKLHIENIKTMPIVSDDIDLCVECGFCEPVCPSREITMTPRQRIVIQRELSLDNSDPSVLKDYAYEAIETCATDGLCELACPVNINTGEYIKSLKQDDVSFFINSISKWAANHFKYTQTFARIALRLGSITKSIIGTRALIAISKVFNRFISTPIWNSSLPSLAPPIYSSEYRTKDKWVYFPSCVNRTLSSDSKKSSLVTILKQISSKSGETFRIPKKINSTCCSQPFSSKGYKDAAILMQEKTIDIIWESSDQGKLPVIMDTSPCTHQLINPHLGLNEVSIKKLEKIKIVDLVQYLRQCVKKSDFPKLDYEIAIHPTCSTEKMGQTSALKSLAEICTTSVHIPKDWGCCGFAGDKGLNYPELNQAATNYPSNDLSEVKYGFSTSRTCEVGMMNYSNINYKSIAYLVRDYLFQSVK